MRKLANSYLIPLKANRVLHIILIGLIVIALRIWHLTVIQHKNRLEESRKPQHKTIYEPAKRGTIRDRFDVPLALNKVQHNVAILYSQIKQIPSITWTIDENGQKIKQYQRKAYIKSLAELLSQELGMDAERVEDLIHAKASFYNQIPFVLKENITEQQYYRLKMLEKDWHGIQVQSAPRRYYPQGNVASDILGYIGPIDREEYESIIGEIKMLENALTALQAGSDDPMPEGIDDEEHLERRHSELLELAYSINDIIGKTGIEGQFERDLRGYRGKKNYFTNARGQYLRELSGNKDPSSGNRLLLTISSELQEYAEQLLVQNENIRHTRLVRIGANKRGILAEKEPWIKGGAIIAMNPNDGEIYAMASHPHFDSNDFIADGGSPTPKVKRDNLLRWLENDVYIADMWNGQRTLEREVWTKEAHLTKDDHHITWDFYLDNVLGKDSATLNTLKLHSTVEDAVIVQRAFAKLITHEIPISAYHQMNALYPNLEQYTSSKKPFAADLELLHNSIQERSLEVAKSLKSLDPYFAPLNRVYDQVLMVDLYRLAADADKFSDPLVKAIGRQSLSQYKEASEAMTTLTSTVKTMSQELFHDLNFKQWREIHEKAFLKEKREEEKIKHLYAKPYIDYLDAKEKSLFNEFWKKHSLKIIATLLKGSPEENLSDKDDEDLQPHLAHFNAWHDEIHQGAHQQAPWAKSYGVLHEILERLPSPLDTEYLGTLRSFQQLDRPLIGSYRSLRKNEDNTQSEKNLAAGFYPKYGYGFARSNSYRQSATQGSIFKLVTSYAALIQQYNSIKGSPMTTASLNPLEIIDTVFMKGKELFVGFDFEGKPIPRFYKGGRLPKSSMTTIGKIDLLKAIETSSNPYFSLIAGDFLKSPQDLANAASAMSMGHRTGIDLPGELNGNIPQDLETNRTGLYSFAIGQHTLVVTPLQTAVMLSTIANGGKVLKPKIVAMTVANKQNELTTTLINTHVRRRLFLPEEIKKLLVQGMCRVVARSHQESLKSLAKLYSSQPHAVQDYVEMKYYLAGKTSTSESVESIDLDATEGTNIYTHVWFGGILYEKPIFEEPNQRFVFKDNTGTPELVVVVYLRYGGYGKEAAPIAAQIAKKWREINASRAQVAVK
jgi:cell division protein FtsI/penicillin-binding protein 2